MASVCRRAAFVLPAFAKAMPSRMPETPADKQANRMMTAGGAPLPTKQIQQGPTHCASCGQSHRLGTLCASKGLAFALADAFAKGVTRSGNKHGNPYHDDSTGRFASASGGAGGGGGGAPAGGAAPSAAPTAGAAPNTAPAAGIGTAQTLQAPAAAPALPTPSAGTGGGTVAGKVNAKPPAGGTVAGKVNAKPAGAPAEAAAPAGAATEKVEFPAGAGGGPFSHEGANAAYHQKRLEAVQGGAPEQAAHQQGMNAGARAYANAQRQLEGQSPYSEAEFAGARQRPAESVATPPQQAAPQAPQQAATPPAAPAQPATGGQQPQAQAPGRPSSNPTPTRAGGKGQAGLLEGAVKPWAAAAGSMGSGVFTPGATAAATGNALGASAHGLLTHDPNAQQKTAAQQYQGRQQQAQQQSGHMQGQQQQYLNRLRGFLGQGGQQR